jgi:hypothetical protein
VKQKATKSVWNWFVKSFYQQQSATTGRFEWIVYGVENKMGNQERIGTEQTNETSIGWFTNKSREHQLASSSFSDTHINKVTKVLGFC